jgi:acetaldehyde dehydrogenase
MAKTKVAIIGSGNIGTDLMIKVMRNSKILEMGALVGIDPDSEGRARADKMGVATTSEGIDGLVKMDVFKDIEILFDATSAGAHKYHDKIAREHGKTMIDMTPAAIGPYVVPVVNLEKLVDAPNINMVSCGGQATIPMVEAVGKVAKVRYAEIVASIASKSAGPGTRANIDEFTETTAKGLEEVGGAERGKAIIVLNPAEPPVMMRNTVYTLSDDADPEKVRESIEKQVADIQDYVPGYRLKQEVQFERIGDNTPLKIPGFGEFVGLKTTIFIEVEGAAHYLPNYAGNLDIMTSAALATAERLIQLRKAA